MILYDTNLQKNKPKIKRKFANDLEDSRQKEQQNTKGI